MTGLLEQERNASLLDWYHRRRRELPWRSSDDPYAILVAEVMLQQTGAGRVVPFFERFMDRFPTLEDLAAAPFTEVVGLWTGLGYNTRAKRLHKAVQGIAATGWPTTVAGLEALPGVGAYTARAVASFAFGAHVAAVDTNLRRVLSRWHGEPLSGAALETAAAQDLAADAATWNQAMMDLGATLCRPRHPGCVVCPVSDWCAGPDVYTAPRSQPRFEGSVRQVRGAVVRRLVHGTADLDELARTTGFGRDHVEAALDGLIEDELVAETDEGFELAD